IPRLANAAEFCTTLSAVSARAWARVERSTLLRRWRNPVSVFLRLRDDVDQVIYAEIAERRNEDLSGRKDMLSALLQARDADGGRLSDAELRDALVTLLEAGHETTANSLAWAFERLARHPEVMARLVDAVDNDDVEYIDAVIKEILRVRPIIAIMPRVLVAP